MLVRNENEICIQKIKIANPCKLKILVRKPKFFLVQVFSLRRPKRRNPIIFRRMIPCPLCQADQAVGFLWFYFTGRELPKDFLCSVPNSFTPWSFPMEEILNDWKKLSLIDVEGKKISLSKSRNQNHKEYVLAARFFTRRALNVEAMGQTFKPLWRSR